MAAPTESCFTCNLFGCKILCLTPHQHYQGIVHTEGQQPTTQGRTQQAGTVSARQVFVAKKRREIWARNAYIVFYSIAALSGVLLLALALAAPRVRGPTYACKNVYIGAQGGICSLGILPPNDPMQTTDYILLCNGCLTLCLVITGIVAAVKMKKHLIYFVTAGFGIAFSIQLAVGGTMCVQQNQDDWEYPYVPTKIQQEVHTSLTNEMDHYQKSTEAKEMWDNLQTLKCCCGVNGYKDWSAHGRVPDSCACVMGRYGGWSCKTNNYGYGYQGTCDNGHVTVDTNLTVPQRGCLQAVLQYIGHHRKEIVRGEIVVVFSVVAPLILALIAPLFGLCLRKCCVPSAGNQVDMSDLQACPTQWRSNVDNGKDDDEPLLGDHDADSPCMVATEEHPQIPYQPVA